MVISRANRGVPMPLDRRRFLALSGGFVIVPGCGFDLNLAPDASFDEVLDAIHRTDLEFRGGLSNHAPMAAEALVALGRPALVAAWVDRYGRKLDAFEDAEPLSEAELTAALGDFERRAAWIAHYDAELQTLDPAALVAREWPTLAPGMFVTALHGTLRTAHALRSLGAADSPSRRRELAFGLGFWASRFDLLPGTPGAAAEAGLDVATALSRVALLPEEERQNEGLIAPRLAPLWDHPEFADLVEAVDLDALPFDEALTALVTAAARAFVHQGQNDFGLLHAITGSSALRLLAPALDDDGRRLGLGYVFQGVAAMYATHGTPDGLDPVPAPTATIDGLVEQALATDDDHAYKLTEAVQRELAFGDRPELLAAAAAYLA